MSGEPSPRFIIPSKTRIKSSGKVSKCTNALYVQHKLASERNGHRTPENSPEVDKNYGLFHERYLFKVRNIYDIKEIQWYTYLFSYLLINPKDNRVVIVESLISPVTLRNSLAEALFQHLNVGSIIRLRKELILLIGLTHSIHAKSVTLYFCYWTSVSFGSGHWV